MPVKSSVIAPVFDENDDLPALIDVHDNIGNINGGDNVLITSENGEIEYLGGNMGNGGYGGNGGNGVGGSEGGYGDEDEEDEDESDYGGEYHGLDDQGMLMFLYVIVCIVCCLCFCTLFSIIVYYFITSTCSN